MFPVLILLVAAVMVAIDQLTKWLAQTFLMGNPPFEIINGVFELRYISNTGAAFGILGGQRALLITITALALTALYAALVSGKLGKAKPVVISCTLIFSGGLGNLVDRIFRHQVVDFFYFKAIDFAIFNIADCYVICGASLMLIYFLFFYKEPLADAASSRAEIQREEDAADGDTDADSAAGESGGQA